MVRLAFFSLVLLASVGVAVLIRASGGPANTSDEESEPQGRERTPFAADRVPENDTKEKTTPVTIDAKRAARYLQTVCDLGPRMSGTPAMRRQQELLTKHFEDLGAKVRLQNFTATQVSRRPQTVEMVNLIVSWHPERQRRVILSSHYDTRPIADQEPNPRKWTERFVSANDGGSGVALLMELGHHMKDLKTGVGVDFVFFDGEEYVFEPNRDQYFFGSKHFAQAWRAEKARRDYVGAVLLDMIAGVNPQFPAEGYSVARCRPLVVQLWDIAQEYGCAAFQNKVGQHVQDDHLALQNVGIPAVDIIDFSYPHWHRLSDLPENCSTDGMEQVARVLTVWLQRVK